MSVNLRKNSDKDAFNNFKADYPPKLALSKINLHKFCKYSHVTKKLIISGR